MTLRWRLTLFYSILLAALLLILGVTVQAVMRETLLRTLKDDLRNTYINLSGFNAFGTSAGAGRTLKPLNQIASTFGTEYGFQLNRWVFSSDADLRASTPQEALDLLQSPDQSDLVNVDQPFKLTPEQFESLRRSGTDRKYIDVQWKVGGFDEPLPALALVQYELLSDGRPNLDGTNTAVPALLWIVKDRTATNNALNELQRIILTAFLLGVPVVGGGAYWLAGRALLPLRQVQRAAERIGGRTLGVRVPQPGTHDEVASLARALNNMLDRLEGSFETQRRFTSDASHELRTPVTAISGHASYLLRRTHPNAQQTESLNIIRSEADRLTNLISSLLELARSDSGVTQLRVQPVLAQLFLSDIARELKPLAQAQGATLSAEGQEVTFLADPDRLKQVLLNLVSNALKAGARHVRLVSSQDGPEVQLAVHDDGPGIAPEHLPKLFDRFYRVDESRARDVGGSGLGLSIVKAIVDAHGGRIWVESQVGDGTSVYVRLPIGKVVMHDEDEPEGERAPQLTRPLGRG